MKKALKIFFYFSIVAIITFSYISKSSTEEDGRSEVLVKEEKNVTIKESLVEKKEMRITLLEINETTTLKEKNSTQENVKLCPKRAFSNMYGKETKIIYKDGEEIIFLNSKKRRYKKYDSEGNLKSDELYNENGELEIGKRLIYEDGFLVQRERNYFLEDGRVLELNVNMLYDESVKLDKQFPKEDISFLTTLRNIPIGEEGLNLNISYHEEYDDEDKKVFAYSKMGNSKYRGIQYYYDDIGQLYATTTTNYRMDRKNITEFYNKDGKVTEGYSESGEEMQKRQSKAKEMAKKNANPNNWTNEMNILVIDKLYKKDLNKKYKYNKKGALIEEYERYPLESNISYIYDKYGNLVMKRRSNGEILFTQEFGVCEE